MMSDPRDDKLTAILAAAWGTPRPGWDARAMAAMAAVRPRRHPNLVTIIVVTLILLGLAAGAYAAARFLLEAKLQFSDATPYPDPEDEGNTALLVPHTVGQDLVWESADKPFVQQRGHNDVSPDGKHKAFQRGNARLGYDMRWCDVYIADADGAHERNVTKAAGLGGINCRPYWSPDGTMIYFAHVDPVEGRSPCRAHYQIWVMDADGSHPHRLTPEGSMGISPGTVRWSPDSTRLLSCWEGKTDPRDLESSIIIAFTVDVRTGQIQVLPNVGRYGKWSPDGSLIASMRTRPDAVNGENGKWNELVVTSADGSNPRVLVQQFIADATIRARYPSAELPQGEPEYDEVDQFWWEVGPVPAAWSPKGNQIAFMAALPWDPDGPEVGQQKEVWVYDLPSNQAMRLTYDNVQQGWVRWK